MLSACSFQLHKYGQEISKFHNGLPGAERISATYFAYGIAARLRTTELRGPGQFCVHRGLWRGVNKHWFLITVFFSVWMLWVLGVFLEPRLMLRAHIMVQNSLKLCKPLAEVRTCRNFCFKALIKLLLKGNEEKAKLNSLKCVWSYKISHKISFYVLQNIPVFLLVQVCAKCYWSDQKPSASVYAGLFSTYKLSSAANWPFSE